MKKHGKKIIEAKKKFFLKQKYNIIDAIILAKKIAYANFVESIDLCINLNINIKKNLQLIKGIIKLPYKIEIGKNKTYKVLVFTDNNNLTFDNEDNINITLGNIDLINTIKISKKKFNYNLVISTNEFMPKLKKIASILGPKGLMPSLQFGTIIDNYKIKEFIDNINYQVKYKLNDNGNIIVKIGNISQKDYIINKNILFFLNQLFKKKYNFIKTIMIKNISISTTMGPKIFINKSNIYTNN